MKRNSEFNSFLASSSRKFFKYGLGLSILFTIVAFKIPIYAYLPDAPVYGEEEYFQIDYLTEVVPVENILKQPKKMKQVDPPLAAIPEASAEELPEVPVKEPEPSPVAILATIASPPAPTPSPEVWKVVEEMPTFIGGEKALFQYFVQEIDYDWYAVDKGISGKVYVRFVVNKKGEIVKAEIARGIHPLLDNEALRVVKNMPNWLPGIQNGENVNVSMVLPINFVLK